MKKICALSLVLVLILSLFAGCGKNPLIGKWEGKADITEAVTTGLKNELGDDFDFDPDPIFVYGTLTLNEDGTYSFEFDEAKTTESVVNMLNGMKDALKETLYQAFEAQGISREDADAAIEESAGMSMDDYLETSMDSLKDEVDLDFAENNEVGTFESKDATLTLHPENNEDETMTFKLDVSKLTLTFDVDQLNLDDDIFDGIDKLEFVFDRVN